IFSGPCSNFICRTMPICNCGKSHCDSTTAEYAEMWRGNEEQRRQAAALTVKEVHDINKICFIMKLTQRMRENVQQLQQLQQSLEPANGA
ncbi:hypothetical protein PRIPAC_93264, partial [Pristionchus pacificus]|uniref:Uncharacterized protein n=1 Tax=Pristionchus pacificus TaxID=54126 RepID=A0A2A6CDS8_PRIPA